LVSNNEETYWPIDFVQLKFKSAITHNKIIEALHHCGKKCSLPLL